MVRTGFTNDSLKLEHHLFSRKRNLTNVAMSYLPMQNSLKIVSRMSSESISPMIHAKLEMASLSSSAASSKSSGAVKNLFRAEMHAFR
jgi:hypothetical protein